MFHSNNPVGILALASIHQPIGGHTPALYQHNSALWVAFSARPNRRLYCQSHVYDQICIFKMPTGSRFQCLFFR